MIVVDGTSTADLQDLTSYIAMAETDEYGGVSLPYRGAGTKTLYVGASGYKHVYKTYTFAQDDLIVDFPDAILETV